MPFVVCPLAAVVKVPELLGLQFRRWFRKLLSLHDFRFCQAQDLSLNVERNVVTAGAQGWFLYTYLSFALWNHFLYIYLSFAIWNHSAQARFSCCSLPNAYLGLLENTLYSNTEVSCLLLKDLNIGSVSFYDRKAPLVGRVGWNDWHFWRMEYWRLCGQYWTWANSQKRARWSCLCGNNHHETWDCWDSVFT